MQLIKISGAVDHEGAPMRNARTSSATKCRMHVSPRPSRALFAGMKHVAPGPAGAQPMKCSLGWRSIGAPVGDDRGGEWCAAVNGAGTGESGSPSASLRRRPMATNRRSVRMRQGKRASHPRTRPGSGARNGGMPTCPGPWFHRQKGLKRTASLQPHRGAALSAAVTLFALNQLSGHTSFGAESCTPRRPHIPFPRRSCSAGWAVPAAD